MKNKFLIALIGLLFVSFFTFETQAQETESKTIDFKYTGELTQEDLINSPYTNRWFEPRFDSYNPDKKSMQTIKENIDDFDIIMFMGAWCPDSHREVPRVFKILEESGYDMDRLTVYTLNNRKQSEDQHEKKYKITNVPTVIFLQNGKEVNRFVERAKETIAKDMTKIVSGEEYKNARYR